MFNSQLFASAFIPKEFYHKLLVVVFVVILIIFDPIVVFIINIIRVKSQNLLISIFVSRLFDIFIFIVILNVFFFLNLLFLSVQVDQIVVYIQLAENVQHNQDNLGIL